MRLHFLELWSVFVKAGVSPHIIFLTVGELGIPQRSSLTPPEMAQVRAEEAKRAMESLTASLTILSFPDLGLPSIPLKDLVGAVMPIVSKSDTDAIFSFDPYENTPFIDHPDHNVAGQVAKYVGAAADVRYFLPHRKPLQKRPELYLWTSKRTSEVTHRVELSPVDRARRNQYLVDHYPSQFAAADRPQWQVIFDSITHEKSGKHSERYIKLR